MRRPLAYALALMVAAALAPTSAGAATVPMTTSTYGSASVTSDSGGTTISVFSPPGGRFYRANLDPSRVYRVIVDGNALSGRWTMHLRRNTGAPAYRPAPQGVEEFQIEKASKVELLLYTSAGAGEYRARSVTVVDCTATCRTDAQLKTQILSETTGLQQALDEGRTYHAAKLLLRWTSPRIPWAGSSSALLEQSGLGTAQIFHDFFEPKRRGVFCGGATVFFQRILSLFGIVNHRLDVGGNTTAALDHTTAVLPFVNTRGETEYRVLDPSWSLDFTIRTSGRAANLPAMWELWRAGLSDRIEINHGSIGSRWVVWGPNADGSMTTRRCSDTRGVTGCSFDEYLTYYAPTYRDAGLDTGFPGFIQLTGTQRITFARESLPPDLTQKHDIFADAVANGKDDVHVSHLPLPPSNDAPPQLSGAQRAGSTLTATTGTWSSPTPIERHDLRWERCDAEGTGCTPVAGATSPEYVLGDADVGRVVRVAVTATNEDGTSDPAHAATGVVVDERPRNTAAPSFTGTAMEGRSLIATAGTWESTGSPTFAYQWVRCPGDGTGCVTIAGATAAKRILTVDDIGTRLKVRVTATSAGGSRTADSGLSAVIAGAPPVNTVPPAIDDASLEGEYVTPTYGKWSGTGPNAYTKQWVRCASDGSACADIAGSTGYRHLLTSADIGKRVRIRVTITSPYGSGTAESALSEVIAPAPPRSTSAPTISNASVAGSYVTSTNGGWAGSGPFTYAKQWVRCAADGTSCQDIVGSTAYRHLLGRADVGKRVRVRITATGSAGSTSALSPLSAVVSSAPLVATAAPTISGTTVDGEALDATTGTWSGTGPIMFTRQWMRCDSTCTAIAGATDTRYRAKAADVGRRLRIDVTAANGFETRTSSSAPTAVVAGAPPQNVTLPSITGAPTVGEYVTAAFGKWSGTGPFTYDKQWLRCDAAGTACAEIDGSTLYRHLLAPADAGSRIRVRITATSPYGEDSAVSTPTAVITP